MPLTTADRQALRVHLTSEFHRWVENLLSRDELPLVGSAVPAMTQPTPRRGTKKTKTKTKAKKKTSREEDKTPREEDKATAPAAPAWEDGQVRTPAASSPEDAGPDDWTTPRKGKRRRSLGPTALPSLASVLGPFPRLQHRRRSSATAARASSTPPVPARILRYARSAADLIGALYALRNALRASRPSTTATYATRTATGGGVVSAETGPSPRSPSAALPLHGKTPWISRHPRPPDPNACRLQRRDAVRHPLLWRTCQVPTWTQQGRQTAAVGLAQPRQPRGHHRTQGRCRLQVWLRDQRALPRRQRCPEETPGPFRLRGPRLQGRQVPQCDQAQLQRPYQQDPSSLRPCHGHRPGTQHHVYDPGHPKEHRWTPGQPGWRDEALLPKGQAPDAGSLQPVVLDVHDPRLPPDPDDPIQGRAVCLVWAM